MVKCPATLQRSRAWRGLEGPHMAKPTPKSAYWVVDVPGGWGVAAVVQGEEGYHPVPDYGPYEDERRAQVTVDSLNARLGVTKVRAHLIVRSTMPALRMQPVLTPAQWRVLKRMPDRPSDGVRLKRGDYMAALSCVDKRLAVLVGRDLVGGCFARLPAGRAALGLS
jgi:hypothetical protein